MKHYLAVILICFTLFIAEITTAQINLTFQGQLKYNTTLSNLWGYVDSVGNEYALVGTFDGLSVVDVTNTTNPSEKFSIQGAQSFWREIKTFKHRAYVTTEGGGGVMIVNLSRLPDTNRVFHFFTDSGKILRAHTLWIDTTEGYLYLFGSNVGNGGAQIYNLNTNPDTPVYAGQYDDYYIHDGFVRGDTLWASHIYAGNLEVVNVTDKASPKFMAVFSTPSERTHNSWPTSNNHYLFTTDEVANSSLTSYDVDSLCCINGLDRIQSDPGTNSTVHNVLLYNNDFATTSYYCDGVVIFDVTHPDDMIEVGNYNTAQSNCNGLNGCWGVYPYLPSKNIIASDIQNGLFILKPNYVHGCWLKGFVKDSLTNVPLLNANVIVEGTPNFANTNNEGFYETGAGDSGLYSIQFSANGYYSKTIKNIHLLRGVFDSLDVTLDPLPYFTLNGIVFDSANNYAFVEKAKVLFQNANNTYVDSTDINGGFSIPNFFPGTYKVFVGKWGYQLHFEKADTIKNGFLTLDYNLHTGYYDDYSLDLGWKDSGTATSGNWVRGVPIGTIIDSEYVNPDATVSSAHNNMCYMTGNGGGYYRNSCLYGGWTKLTSPFFNLSKYKDPYISYYTWFFNLRNKLPASDSLVVTLHSKNNSTVLQTLKLTNTDTCQWVYQKFRVLDFAPLADSMFVSFYAQNVDSADNVLKAALDVFEINDSIPGGINSIQSSPFDFSVYPNPFEGSTSVSYSIIGSSDSYLSVSDMTGRELCSFKLRNYKGVLIPSLNYFPAGMYIFQLKSGNTILKSIKVAKTD